MLTGVLLQPDEPTLSQQYLIQPCSAEQAQHPISLSTVWTENYGPCSYVHGAWHLMPPWSLSSSRVHPEPQPSQSHKGHDFRWINSGTIWQHNDLFDREHLASEDSSATHIWRDTARPQLKDSAVGYTHHHSQAGIAKHGANQCWHQHPRRTRFDSASSTAGHCSMKSLQQTSRTSMLEPRTDNLCTSSTCSDADSFQHGQSSSGTLEDELSAELAELLQLCDRDAREQQAVTAERSSRYPPQTLPGQQGMQPASHHMQQLSYPAADRQQQSSIELGKVTRQHQQSPASVRLLHARAPCMSEERRRQPRPKRRALTTPSVRRSLKASFDAAAWQAGVVASQYNPLFSRCQTSADASPVCDQHKMVSPHQSKAAMGASTHWSRTSEAAASQMVSDLAVILADMHGHGRLHGSIYRQALQMLPDRGPPAGIPAHIPSCLDSRWHEPQSASEDLPKASAECAEPPEMLSAPDGHVPPSCAGDLWALGTVIFALLTGGYAPFTAAELARLGRGHAIDRQQHWLDSRLDSLLLSNLQLGLHALSASVQELLRNLLRADPAQRMNARAVQEHRWTRSSLVTYPSQLHQENTSLIGNRGCGTQVARSLQSFKNLMIHPIGSDEDHAQPGASQHRASGISRQPAGASQQSRAQASSHQQPIGSSSTSASASAAMSPKHGSAAGRSSQAVGDDHISSSSSSSSSHSMLMWLQRLMGRPVPRAGKASEGLQGQGPDVPRHVQLAGHL